MPSTALPGAKPPNKPKRPAHRPTKFSAELGKEICALSASGWSMKDVARYFGISPETVCRWVVRHEGFREVYALAREIAADAMAEAKGTGPDRRRGEAAGSRRDQRDNRQVAVLTTVTPTMLMRGLRAES